MAVTNVVAVGEPINHEIVTLPNIRSAMLRSWPEVDTVEAPHDIPLAIVGSGPSVASQHQALRDFPGHVWSVNYAFHWMLPEGIRTDAVVMCDFRDFMADIVQPVEGPTYYLASVCAPRLLDKLAPFKPILIHLDMAGVEEPHNKLVVFGGTTTVTRAICLGWITGYREFHLYGFDSCSAEDKQWRIEGYPSGEGLDETNEPMKVVLPDGTKFRTSAGHLMQCQDFIQLEERFGFNITAHDGRLLSHVLKCHREALFVTPRQVQEAADKLLKASSTHI